MIDGSGGTPFINEQVKIYFDVFKLSAHYPHFDNATNIKIPLVQRPNGTLLEETLFELFVLFRFVATLE